MLASALAIASSLVAGAAIAAPPGSIVTAAKAEKSGSAKARKAAKLKRLRLHLVASTARPPAQPGVRPARHLILIPGGGFTFHDSTFWPVVAPAAAAAGFVPHLLKYRLYDLGGAVADARAFAQDLSRRYGRENVFAYGSSAGGTLAALLASEGLVSSAVSSSGLYDFRYWPWAELDRGPDYLYSIGADWESRRNHSPISHQLRCPLLSVHGNWDPVVSIFQAEDYVATHPRASLRIYVGGHGLYRTRPSSVTGSMRWLNRMANKQAQISRRPMPRNAWAAQAARRIRCG